MPAKHAIKILYGESDEQVQSTQAAEMKKAGLEDLYTLEEVDIEKDAELFRRYRYEIPVLCINGVEAFRHQLTAESFKSYLTSLL